VPRHSRRGDSGDAGIATVWAATAVAALVLVAGGMFWIGSAVLARHRAAGAADLAALAAAGRTHRGVDDACGLARGISERMHARLRTCTVESWDVLVQVEVDLPGPLATLGPARGRARAGPVQRLP